MSPKTLSAACLASLLLAGSVPAATLTIMPDKSTYLVGEVITLGVVGDAEGASDNRIYGRLLFDPGLASYVDSSQEQLTSFGGVVPWNVGPLSGGLGYAEAFLQGTVSTPRVPDQALSASVQLLATAPGTLGYSWNLEGIDFFDFFGLTDAPGGDVTIVPEPASGLLLGLGLIGLAAHRTVTARLDPSRPAARRGEG